TEALAQLTAARAEHAAAQDRWQQQLDQAASTHREQIVGLEHRIELLTGQLDEHRERLTRAIAEKDAAAATAAEHTRRLEAELTAARTAAAAERDRAEAARADAAAAHAQAEAARERIAELRAELQDLRPPPAGPGTPSWGPCTTDCRSWSTSRFEGGRPGILRSGHPRRTPCGGDAFCAEAITHRRPGRRRRRRPWGVVCPPEPGPCVIASVRAGAWSN